MKKMRKLLAVLMTLAMVMGLGMTSFAAITGSTITVDGLSTAGEQSVKVYEIYRLDENNNLWVLSKWAEDANVLTSEEDLAIPEKIAALEAAVSEDDVVATKTTTNGVAEFTEDKDGNELQAGAYLVIAVDGTNNTTYNPMVAVTYKYDEEEDDATHLLIPDDATVTAKASGYDIDKDIVADTDKVYEVGDLVQYTVTTTVPYLANGETAKAFTITDTLTGATYFLTGTTAKGEVAVSTVTVGGQPVEGLAIPTEAHEADSFTLDLSSLINEDNTNAGKVVVITYTAKVAAADTVSNKVSSTFVPDVEKDTVGYTGQVTINKYNEDMNQVLSGATFVLYRLQEDGTKEYAMLDANNYVTGVWTTDIDEAGTVTTNDEGYATIKGLNVGTYYFQETIAPNGYKLNPTGEDVVEVEVTKTEAEAGVTVAGSADMQNSKLIALPATGGIGTTIFTIGGCAIMVVAAYMFFVSRRKDEE